MAHDDPGKKTTNRPDQTDCDAVDALIPAYSLGATDPDESQFMQQHLADCPGAAARLAEYHRLVETLHYSAPPVNPPLALHEQLLAAIARPASTRWSAGRGPRTMPDRWRSLAAGVLIVFLAGTTVYYAVQFNGLSGQFQPLASRLEAQTEALLMVSADNVARIAIPNGGPSSQNSPRAVLLCDPQGTIGLLQVENLAAATRYEIQLSHGSQVIDTALFQADQTGSALTVIHTLQRMGSFDKIAIISLSDADQAGAPILTGPLYMD